MRMLVTDQMSSDKNKCLRTTGIPTDHRNSCFTAAPHIPSKGCPWDRLILVAGGKSDVYLTEIINESISEQYYKECSGIF